MAERSNSLEAITRKLSQRSALTGVLSVIAAGTTLVASFLQSKSSHTAELLAITASAAIAALIATVLQLSKARFERNAIVSVVDTKSLVDVTPEAARAITALAPEAQIHSLELVQRLSSNPLEIIQMSQRLTSLPDVFQTRINEKYRIVWRLNSKEPSDITILDLVNREDRKSAKDSDCVSTAY